MASDVLTKRGGTVWRKSGAEAAYKRGGIRELARWGRMGEKSTGGIQAGHYQHAKTGKLYYGSQPPSKDYGIISQKSFERQKAAGTPVYQAPMSTKQTPTKSAALQQPMSTKQTPSPAARAMKTQSYYVYEMSSGRVEARTGRFGVGSGTPLISVKPGERIVRKARYTVRAPRDSFTSETEADVIEYHKTGKIRREAPTQKPVSVPVDMPSTNLPAEPPVGSYESLSYHGTTPSFAVFGAPDKKTGLPSIIHPTYSKGEMPLVERGAAGVAPLTEAAYGFREQAYTTGISLAEPTKGSVFYPLVRSGAEVTSGFVSGAITFVPAMMTAPFTVPYAVAHPTETGAALIQDVAGRPLFFAGDILGSGLTGGMIAKKLKVPRAPKPKTYKVEYFYGMADISEDLKVMAKPGSVRPDYLKVMQRFVPGDENILIKVRRGAIKNMQKVSEIDNLGALFDDDLIRGIGRTTSRTETKIFTSKVRERLTRPPDPVDEITLMYTGAAGRRVTGSGFIDGVDIGVRSSKVVRMFSPVESPKITKIVTRGKPSSPPFGDFVDPLGTAAGRARANIFSKTPAADWAGAGWFDDIRKPVVQQLAPTRQIQTQGRRVVLGYERVRDLGDFIVGFDDLISPQAAAVVGVETMTMPTQRTASGYELGFALDEFLSSRGRVRMGVGQRSRMDIAQLRMMGSRLDLAPRIGVDTRQDVSQRSRMDMAFSSLRSPATKRAGRGLPLEEPPIPDFGGFPSFYLPRIDVDRKQRRQKRKRKEGKRRYQYTPSLAAIFFDIGAQSRPGGVFTGVGIRPVVRRRRK